MKFNGIKPNAGNTVHCVIPRQDSKNILFIAKGIFDYSAFDEQFPTPIPPQIVSAKLGTFLDYDDEEYIAKVDAWSSQKTAYMVLKSLAATPNLEWETVDMAKPETWTNYEAELQEFLYPAEVNEVINAVLTACALTGDKITEATQSFLSGAEMMLLNPVSSSQTTDR